MNLKNYKEEFLFVFAIILLIAIWKIYQIMKENDKYIIKHNTITGILEGMSTEERKETENIISQTNQILAEANNLIMEKTLNAQSNNGKEGFGGGSGGGAFSQLYNYATNALMPGTEGYTDKTTENEMTIFQRMKAATSLDFPSISINSNSNSNRNSTAPLPPPQRIASNVGVIEGLENNDKVKITSISDSKDDTFKFKLRDYYIKASYNSFNDGDFDYSTLSMDSCLYVLSRGCRFIDFEVYSIDNVPVISSSSQNDFTNKKSQNNIPVADAFEVLGNYAFSSAKCPNPEDPFIIHMRMMSQNVTMYNNLENIIKNSKGVASRLLGPKYGREYQSNDLGDENIEDFKGKIIIIVDGTNPVYKKTGFYQFVNMSSGSLFLSKKSFFDVQTRIDSQQFKEANKKNMSLVLPDKAAKPKNVGHNGPFTWGCQIVAMCFQESARDEKLDAYEGAFNGVGFAFILKPKDLRYIPITIAPPAPPNPNSSFEGKPASAPGIGALPPF